MVERVLYSCNCMKFMYAEDTVRNKNIFFVSSCSHKTSSKVLFNGLLPNFGWQLDILSAHISSMNLVLMKNMQNLLS